MSQETGRLADQSAVRSLVLGDARLTYVVDGAMAFRTEKFFPGTPTEYWSRNPETVDARGRVVMSAGGLLVERADRVLLIDAGLGALTGENALGAVNCGALLETLAAVGHQPAAIDTVAFTHLHADHTGWAFSPDEHGTYRPTFPQARYLVADQEWAPFGRGDTVAGASSPRTVIKPLITAHTLFEDGDEIFPGVHALVTPGHTAGHTSYVITTPAGRFIAFGDAFHTPGQLAHPEWPSGPDLDGGLVPRARRRLLAELEKPHTFGFAFHFGDQAFGRIRRNNANAVEWQPIPARAVGPAPRALG